MVEPLKQMAKTIFTDLYSSYDFVLEYFTLFQDRYWKRRLLDSVDLSRGDYLLDIGCGTGVLEESLEEFGISVTGIDITKEMIELAEAKQISCFDLIGLGDAEALPFRAESFDSVLSCYVVKYCRCPIFVDQIYRVLKPGGQLALYDFAKPHGIFAPFYYYYVYGVLRLFGVLTKRIDHGMSFTFSELPNIISRTQWQKELSEALARRGFENVISISMSGGSAKLFSASKPSNANKLK